MQIAGHQQSARNKKASWGIGVWVTGALALAASSLSCSKPGYRTEVYPGEQGQYVLKTVPNPPAAENPSPVADPAAVPSSPMVQATPAAPPAHALPAAPATMPMDANLNQVEMLWPKLSDSDKSLLVETAKHLAAQR